MPRQEEQPRFKSYNTELSVTGKGAAEPFGRFIPPHPTNADKFAAESSEDSQNLNQTTVFNGKLTGTDQPRDTGMQMSPSEPAPAGITGVRDVTQEGLTNRRNTNYTSIITKEIIFNWRDTDYSSMKQCT